MAAHPPVVAMVAIVVAP
jgi:hypothetical protein